jgi:hypothetical protein
MNTMNASTGFSGFQLKTGWSPHIIPPIAPLTKNATTNEITTHNIITQVNLDVQKAQDNLLSAKIHQAYHENECWAPEDVYEVGDLVMLSTKNQHHCNYKCKGKTQVAKFMPWHDGSYTVTHMFPKHSEYTLKLPNNPNTFPGFHAHLLMWYIPNDPLLFPNCEPAWPCPIVTEDGTRSGILTRSWMHTNTAAVYNTLSVMKAMGRNMMRGTLAQKWLTLTPLANGKMKMGLRSETHTNFSSGEESKPG